MIRLLAVVVLSPALVGVRAVHADDIPPCNAPEGVKVVQRLSETPDALRRAVDAKIGQMANPGERFNATDVVMDHLPADRLIFIWNRRDIWIVATEHGGIGYSDPIFSYHLGRDGKPATLVAARSAIPNTVCKTAKDLLISIVHN